MIRPMLPVHEVDIGTTEEDNDASSLLWPLRVHQRHVKSDSHTHRHVDRQMSYPKRKDHTPSEQ